MPDRLLTPSKITAWLDCAHFLTLQHEVEAGTRKVESSPFGEMAQMLLDKGMEHEQAVLERYRDDGLSVFEVPDRRQYESFRGWVDRVGDVLAEGHDVVFQMPFVHEGIRGIADFLLRVDDPETGTFSYEPIDAKLARKEAKPGHVLQLCFYAEAIEASTGVLPEFVSIELGSGWSEQVRVADVLPYWRRLRSRSRRCSPTRRWPTRGPSPAITASSASSSWCATRSGARPTRSCTLPVFVPRIGSRCSETA